MKRIIVGLRRETRATMARLTLKWPMTSVSDRPVASGIGVTLTSFPARIGSVWLTLETIYRQSVLPETVWLVLSRDEFPDGRIPASVQRYTRQGLEIHYVSGNTRSYKKLLPALSERPDLTWVTADDDVLYPSSWLETLASRHTVVPRSVLGHRGTEIAMGEGDMARPYISWPQANLETPSRLTFLTGMGGILYPSEVLPPEVHDVKLAQLLCPTADDIWFKAMELLSGCDVQKVSSQEEEFLGVRSAQRHSLRDQNVGNSQNDVQFRAVMNHFNLWPKLANRD